MNPEEAYQQGLAAKFLDPNPYWQKRKRGRPSKDAILRLKCYWEWQRGYEVNNPDPLIEFLSKLNQSVIIQGESLNEPLKVYYIPRIIDEQ